MCSAMFRICKTIEVESGHMLSKHPGNCRFPHGHTRAVELIFVAESLDDNDMVMDFKAVKAMMDDFLDRFDHALCVNTKDPMFETLRTQYGERIIPFEDADPTSEMMAWVIFEHARQALELAKQGEGSWPVRQEVKLERVRVWETSSSWSEYQA